ncbi:ParA family protein [Terasakiella sp. SH-1]|uniref:ParA family protein n=1 Tax=Terasakiella sp. SH-1 TaxID=2560057 RepID=UPI0014307FDC|nr:ParA family protein [Terasakiella sp. SH-1]
MKKDDGFVIALSSGKGGPGKTTTAFSLAEYWSSAGKTVAVVDCDPNHNITNWFNKRKIDAEVISEDESLVDGIKWVQELEAENIIDTGLSLQADYDVTIIDVAGVLSNHQLYAASIADLVIVPAQPSEDDIIEAVKTKKIIQNASRLGKRDIPFRLLLTRTKYSNAYKFAKEQVKDFEFPHFDTEIKDLTIFKEARFSGSSPEVLNPKSKGAELIRELAKEIETIVSL